MHKVLHFYTANTGYVIQQATPYYEELTVRENLILAAQMKLAKTSSKFDVLESLVPQQVRRSKISTMRKRFQRVEEVMDVVSVCVYVVCVCKCVCVHYTTFSLQTGLLELADTVVGGTTGPGLSGGQV